MFSPFYTLPNVSFFPLGTSSPGEGGAPSAVGDVDPMKLLSSSGLDRYVCDANDALAMALVRDPLGAEDLDTEAFPPDMTHQIYGDQ